MVLKRGGRVTLESSLIVHADQSFEFSRKFGRGFKGIKMAGRMGAARTTTQNLTVHAVDTDRGLLLIKGAIPGPKGGIVLVRTAAKGAAL